MFCNEIDVHDRSKAEGSDFKTDADISKSNQLDLIGRELESASSWLGDGGENPDWAMTSNADDVPFDQFEVNRVKFSR